MDCENLLMLIKPDSTICRKRGHGQSHYSMHQARWGLFKNPLAVAVLI